MDFQDAKAENGKKTIEFEHMPYANNTYPISNIHILTAGPLHTRSHMCENGWEHISEHEINKP